MKFGAFYAYWDKWDLDLIEYTAKAGPMGLDVLELAGPPLLNLSGPQVEALREAGEQNHIEFTVGYSASPEHDLSRASSQQQEEILQWYRKLFERMSRINSTKLAGVLYTSWPADYSQPFEKEVIWKRSVEGMRLLGKLAAEFGITLCMESVNRYETFLLNTAEENVRYVEEVGVPNVKVHLDTFHMNIEEDSIPEAIRTAGKHLGHFHVAEANRKCPGKGRLPWHEIGTALKDIGYDGCVVTEAFIRTGGEIGNMIRLWRDLSEGADADQMDEEMKRSIAFLKHVFQ